MPERVAFVDRSILLNYLDVPSKNQDRDAIVAEMKRKEADGVLMILPVAAVIEAGNHISHLANGSVRRRCSQALEIILRKAVDRSAPWTLHAAVWDELFLTSLCDGVMGRVPALVESMSTGELGVGDLSILTERECYLARAAVNEVSVWTLDGKLAAYS
jgi:hypothetical protein